MAPFELIIGMNMKLKDDLQVHSSLNEKTIAGFHHGLSQLEDEVIANLTEILNRNKKAADRKKKK